jgi:hypothetical protein
MQSAGAKHYGKGKSYNFFLGKDATRAYVTGVVIPQSEPWVLHSRHLTLALGTNSVYAGAFTADLARADLQSSWRVGVDNTSAEGQCIV